MKNKVGAYVAYAPASTNLTTYSTTQEGLERSGNDTEQTINKDDSLTWRVLSVEGSKVTLMATEPSAGILTLKGANYDYTLSTYKGTSMTQHALATCGTANTGTTSHTAYWLASRCIYCVDSCMSFCLFRVYYGDVSASSPYSSGNDTDNASFAIRPCIELDLSKVNIGITGTGIDTANAYSIAAK